VKLAVHKRFQVICVLGKTGIDGNETADQLARQRSLHPLIRPEPALGISAKGASAVVWNGRAENLRSIGRPYVDRGWLTAFFKKCSVQKAGQLLSLSRNQLRIMTGLLTGHCTGVLISP
jgi:hypothetical protein